MEPPPRDDFDDVCRDANAHGAGCPRVPGFFHAPDRSAAADSARHARIVSRAGAGPIRHQRAGHAAHGGRLRIQFSRCRAADCRPANAHCGSGARARWAALTHGTRSAQSLARSLPDSGCCRAWEVFICSRQRRRANLVLAAVLSLRVGAASAWKIDRRCARISFCWSLPPSSVSRIIFTIPPSPPSIP